jgi:CCR4-NOT transcription complex subunit 1
MSIETPYIDVKHEGQDCLELRMLLAEWIRLCQHPMVSKEIRKSVIEKIMAQTRDGDEQICFLFRLYTETCVNQYLASKQASTIHHRRMIHLIDSYTRLVSAMITEDTSSDENKLRLLNNSFSVIILILSHHHQSKGIHFNQKPFLRLFVSLFNEISKIHMKSIDNSAMIIFR